VSREGFEGEYLRRYRANPGRYNGVHYEDERAQTLWAWWQAARRDHHCRSCDGHSCDERAQDREQP
jgi:hypothetical protein